MVKMKIEFIVFNLDRVLVEYGAPSCWELIDRELHCEEEDKKLNRAFKEGEFDVRTLSEKTAQLYAKYGLTRQKLDRILRTYVTPMKSASEVLEEAKNRGIVTGIVSGSLLNFYHFLQEQYGISADKVSIAHSLSFDRKGRLSGGHFTNYDYEGKFRVIKMFCDELGVSTVQTAFVGNSENDIYAFRKIGLPIAFNTSNEEVRKAAAVIEEKDLREVLKYI